ncbi:MAG: hypothetical protein AMXMBFR7_19730 [Planctomycetota bacterium]
MAFRTVPALSRGFLLAVLGAVCAYGADGPSPLAEFARRQSEVCERIAPAVAAIECQAGPRRERYYGAGVLVAPEGLVLTAATVVPPHAEAISVILKDGRRFRAEWAGSDAATEAVVLRLADPGGAPLPFLKPGRPETVAVGARVYAAGNPHRTLERDGEVYFRALTLSGRYRVASDDERSRYAGPALELDQVVNFGSDGGVLADADGRLLGLLSLAYARERGLGLAIPLDRIRAALPDALAPMKRYDALDEPVQGASNDPNAALERALAAAAQRAEPALACILLPGRTGTPALQAQAEPAAPRPVSQPYEMPAPAARGPGEDGAVLTGVLVEPRGTLLTAASALPEEPERFEVRLSDGRVRAARRAGRHRGLDLAVLLLELRDDEPVSTLHLSAAGPPEAGRFVAVLGAAPDAESPPTRVRGIVSASNRMEGQALQLDARLNHGNAGGAVLDLSGRLVGIVAHLGLKKVWAPNSGVGFCAPSERIAAELEGLRAGRDVAAATQAYLGVSPAVGETLYEGVRLAGVQPASPAWEAGLRAGDTITALDGESVRSWPSLVARLKRCAPGAAVAVRFLREGRLLRAAVTMGAAE